MDVAFRLDPGHYYDLSDLSLSFSLKTLFIYLFIFRDWEGRGWDRNINVWLPVMRPLLALTGNWTSDSLVHRLKPIHTETRQPGQKFLIFTKSTLSVICFVGHAFGVTSKKSSKHLRSPRFSPMFLSRSFMGLHFPFRAVIHFMFIFCGGWKVWILFFFLHVDIYLFQHHCRKDYLSSIVLPVLLCQR